MVLPIISVDPVLVQLSAGNLKSYYFSYLIFVSQEVLVMVGFFCFFSIQNMFYWQEQLSFTNCDN